MTETSPRRKPPAQIGDEPMTRLMQFKAPESLYQACKRLPRGEISRIVRAALEQAIKAA